MGWLRSNKGGGAVLEGMGSSELEWVGVIDSIRLRRRRGSIRRDVRALV